jgi:hypothetical protein
LPLLLPAVIVQLSEALRGKRSAEQKAMQLNQELIQTRNTANQVGPDAQCGQRMLGLMCLTNS